MRISLNKNLAKYGGSSVCFVGGFMIVWAGVIKGDVENLTGAMPQNAKRLNMPDSIGGLLVAAIPFAIPSFVLCMALWFFKILTNKEWLRFPVLFAGCLAGLAIGFLLILLHEYLHAMVYPKKATVEIAIAPKSFAAVIRVSYPLSKHRFVVMSLLPTILGIIPLGVFLLIPFSFQFLNGLFWGVAMMGLIAVYPDFFHVYQVLKQVPPNGNVQFSGSHLYWFK